MTAPVDLGLLTDIQRFGASRHHRLLQLRHLHGDLPAVRGRQHFPRRMIRYAQVGMKDALLSSKELWTCYHCGECSESCPTQADPGEFMAAARRYAIASYDRTRLARMMYTLAGLGDGSSPCWPPFFALFMYTAHGPQDGETLAIFEFIPGAHPQPGHRRDGPRRARRRSPASPRWPGGCPRRGRGRGAPARRPGRAGPRGRAAWCAIGRESLAQRASARTAPTRARPGPVPARAGSSMRSRCGASWACSRATVLDYGLALVGIKATGTPVPIWYPVRLLGTVAGLAARLRHHGADRGGGCAGATAPSAQSTAADWTFLRLLVGDRRDRASSSSSALYLPSRPAWGYWVFLVHVAVAMELVLLAPFMKFAHAIYRPLALFAFRLRSSPGV